MTTKEALKIMYENRLAELDKAITGASKVVDGMPDLLNGTSIAKEVLLQKYASIHDYLLIAENTLSAVRDFSSSLSIADE